MGNILSQMWGELTDSVPSNAVHVNEKPQGDSHYFWVGGLASIYLRGLGNFLGMEGGGDFLCLCLLTYAYRLFVMLHARFKILHAAHASTQRGSSITRRRSQQGLWVVVRESQT